MDLYQMFDQAGIGYKDHGVNVGRNRVNICCPFCGEDRFHCRIHLDHHGFHCWLCGESGRWAKLARQLYQLCPIVDWYSLDNEVSHFIDQAGSRAEVIQDQQFRKLFKPFKSYSYKDLISISDRRALKFLLDERQLSKSLLQRIQPGIGIGNWHGYVTFREGNELIGRRYQGKGPRYLRSGNEQILYGAQFVGESNSDWVVLTEGIFDVLALPLGRGLAILGSVFNDTWIDILLNILPSSTKDIILALDSGVGGNTLNKTKLELADLGYTIHVWDWFNPDYKRLEDPDLDLVRKKYGYNYVYDQCLSILGRDLDFSELI